MSLQKIQITNIDEHNYQRVERVEMKIEIRYLTKSTELNTANKNNYTTATTKRRRFPRPTQEARELLRNVAKVFVYGGVKKKMDRLLLYFFGDAFQEHTMNIIL